MLRNILDLIEASQHHLHVWHTASKQDAHALIEEGISVGEEGRFGLGFYCDGRPQDGEIILEYVVRPNHEILDLHDKQDQARWRRYRSRHQNLPEHGIDGVCDGTDYCFFNPDALHFRRVYAGVVDDPLETTNVHELDELALGGLRRCTAVTVNALLGAFHKPGITLSEVPINHPGVLQILAAKGLAYRPHPEHTGRTVQQFINMHRMGDWYLLTPGHAMAVVQGDLYDAENKGADQRKLAAAFEITRR